MKIVLGRAAPLVLATLLISTAYFLLVPDGQGSFFVPVLVFVGVGLLLWGRKDRADLLAVRELLAGSPHRPGRWTAVAGTATELEPAPDAMLEGILAGRLEVFDRVRSANRGSIRPSSSGKMLERRYDGFFLRPSGIDTGTDTVRLSGFPDLVHTDKAPLPNDLIVGIKRGARLSPRYLPAALARELLLADVDGRINACLRYGQHGETSEGTSKSWLLRPGQRVCVFGIWRDGALCRARHRPRGLPVYNGTAEEVRERLAGDSAAFFIIGGIVLAAAMTLALWTMI